MKDNKKTFDTGAQRQSKVAGEGSDFPLRYDLLVSQLPFMKRMARTFGEGSLKYGDDNWRNGIPEKDCVNHMIAHLVQWLSGDRTEDHLAHMVWNGMTIMWLEENRPDLLDLCKLALKGSGIMGGLVTPVNTENLQACKQDRRLTDEEAIEAGRLAHILAGNTMVKFSIQDDNLITFAMLTPLELTVSQLATLRGLAFGINQSK